MTKFEDIGVDLNKVCTKNILLLLGLLKEDMVYGWGSNRRKVCL